MPIPEPIDRRLAELDDLAASVLLAVRIFAHTPSDGRQIRERLQIFNDAVIDIANQIIANAHAR
jgi:hypothetical protein